MKNESIHCSTLKTCKIILCTDMYTASSTQIIIVQHLLRFSQSDWLNAQDAALRNFGLLHAVQQSGWMSHACDVIIQTACSKSEMQSDRFLLSSFELSQI